jgi:hypothetical protein
MSLSDFGVNLLVEIAGLAIGIPVGAYVAIRLARRRLRKVAPPLIHLIKQLREDEQISRPAARACVVCTARVLAYELERQPRLGTIAKQQNDPCAVCDLQYKINTELGKSCSHCGLSENIWDLTGKPV